MKSAHEIAEVCTPRGALRKAGRSRKICLRCARGCESGSHTVPLLSRECQFPRARTVHSSSLCVSESTSTHKVQNEGAAAHLRSQTPSRDALSTLRGSLCRHAAHTFRQIQSVSSHSNESEGAVGRRGHNHPCNSSHCGAQPHLWSALLAESGRRSKDAAVSSTPGDPALLCARFWAAFSPPRPSSFFNLVNAQPKV